MLSLLLPLQTDEEARELLAQFEYAVCKIVRRDFMAKKSLKIKQQRHG